MKIAVNTRFLIQDKLEGIGTYTQEICRRMAINHPETEFHFFFDRSFHKSFIYGDNVIPHILRPPARHPYLWYIWFEWMVPWFLKNLEVDAFFSPDMFLSLSASTPTLMTSHDLAYIHYPEHIRKSHLDYFRKYFPMFHRRADVISCVSENTKRDVQINYGIPEEKLFVAHNACKEKFKPLSNEMIRAFRAEWTDNKPYALYLGAANPRKNIPGLIKAFEDYKRIYRDDLKLILAGRWAKGKGEVYQMIETSPFKEDIRCLICPEFLVSKLVGAAEMMVYPSFYEGFGIPILEAMQCGVPVITSNTGAMPEVAGKGALLINPGNVSEITAAIRTIRTNRRLRESLVKMGKERSASFRWDLSAELIYENLCGLTLS